MNYVYILKFLGVALSIFLCDICWVYYTLKVQERNPLHSALWGVGIIVLGALSVEGYMSDSTLIIAAAIGAFIGTYISVKYKK